MADNTKGTTVPVSFLSCNPDQTPLFSVNRGVPVEDALTMVSCILDDAMRVIESDEEMSYAAHRLMMMAKAAVDAVIKSDGVERGEDRRFSATLARLHQLCAEGVIIINPAAVKHEMDDASQFLGWVEEQVTGTRAEKTKKESSKSDNHSLAIACSEYELTTALVDIANLGKGCVNDLQALFLAIGSLVDEGDFKIKGIISCATYLCDDWQGLIGEEAEPYIERREAARAMSMAEKEPS